MSCKCADYDSDEGRYICSVSGDGCVYMIPDSKKCAEEYEEGPDVIGEGEEQTCGTPYTDLYVGVKFTIETSEYCKAIREEDTAPAFGTALCQKCLDKKCEFIGLCAELFDMKMRADYGTDADE